MNYKKTRFVKDWERINKHEQYFESVLPHILPYVKRMQYKLRRDKKVMVIASYHSKIREMDRKISYRAILDVLKWGRVIEFQGYDKIPDEFEVIPTNEPCVNVILAKKVFNNGKYHYLHVCVNIQGDNVVIKTVYDPKTMYWQWMDNYTKRVFYKEVNKVNRKGEITGFYST